MKLDNRDRWWIYLFGAVILAITGVVYWGYFLPEWKDYQAGFRDLVSKRFGADCARIVPSGIQQVWANDLGRVDRCVTCHQGIEWKGLENAPQPYRAHPPGNSGEASGFKVRMHVLPWGTGLRH